jgi:hypothetical protein
MSRRDRDRARFLLEAVSWRRRIQTQHTTRRLDMAACYARMQARRPAYMIRGNTWLSAREHAA